VESDVATGHDEHGGHKTRIEKSLRGKGAQFKNNVLFRPGYPGNEFPTRRVCVQL
jgi:hypothetical protein